MGDLIPLFPGSQEALEGIQLRGLLLDLDKEDLYGFERDRNPYILQSIDRGIDAGDTFPAVRVLLVHPSPRFFSCNVSSEPVYFIEKDRPDHRIGRRPEGGHHRAFAHWIRGEPLLCELVGEVIGNPYFFPVNIKTGSYVLAEDAFQQRAFFQKKLVSGKVYR